MQTLKGVCEAEEIDAMTLLRFFSYFIREM